ncbi:MAG: ArsR family transcriptional regulator [Porticoccaceae bacterium]|nr:MAG: ArsR family transcriptional regulator [Porticoccaceae bacterium]
MDAPTPAHPDASALAALLKAAGDPLRLALLRTLREGAYGALELAELLGVRQNSLSHHLKVLHQAGLVASRREGTHIFYRRNPAPPHPELAEALFAAAGRLPEPPGLAERLARVHEARAEASRAFFRQHAERFRERQDLIAGFAHYGEAVLAALDRCRRGSEAALEVGPGAGELLAGLARRFRQLWALDNSREMLALAQAAARRQGLAGVRFVLGDAARERFPGQRFDAVTLNMVLHHVPAPAAVVDNLSRHLAPGGVLLVTELVAHQQDWVREACGDLWLGFEPAELTELARRAGLVDLGGEYLALVNGFSIQIRPFGRPPVAGAVGENP